mmetsp:Transcript_30094/g.70971  ORF Transcript_30094/g.70971 Transcript_30094/m.70971 type:complete len:180 (-) Transcript_30094:67-606(-)
MHAVVASPRSGAHSRFRQLAAPLAQELLGTLEREHQREICALYNEQVMLREELQRVLQLMEREFIPRERMVHDMLEKLSSTYSQATAHFHAQNSQLHDQAQRHAQQHDAQRRQFIDPLVEAESELSRIQQLLARPPSVAPGLPPELLREAEQRAQQRPRLSSQPWAPGRASLACQQQVL